MPKITLIYTPCCAPGDLIRYAVAQWRGGRSADQMRSARGRTLDVGLYACRVTPLPVEPHGPVVVKTELVSGQLTVAQAWIQLL